MVSLGKIYGPYTGRCFGSTRETDIEHMVATSEAHDSGLCAAPRSVKAAFASDLLNLTLAAPRVNRYSKSGKDVAEWTPDLNACWFVALTIEVRRKYGLTIDRAEATAAEAVLSRCEETTMEVLPCAAGTLPVTPVPPRGAGAAEPDDALTMTTGTGALLVPKLGATGSPRCRGATPLPAHARWRRGRHGLRVAVRGVPVAEALAGRNLPPLPRGPTGTAHARSVRVALRHSATARQPRRWHGP